MSLGSSNKGVLYLTDDSLFIYKVSGKSVSLLEVIDWEQDDIGTLLTSIIKKNFSVVIVLNDTVDQHYRKEKVPKVGILDSGKVVERRLMMAFPEFPIRTFKKTGKIPKTSSDELAMEGFLFFACPDNIHIVTIINSIRDSGVSFQGLSLLPMESEGLVDDLFKGLSKSKSLFSSKKQNKKPSSGWSIFVGQNSSGGLRQIVVKDGGVALTRISPIVETDADISLWCQDIKREISSTMGYLSRFGYKPEDELKIVIIGKPDSAAIFDEIIDVDTDVNVLSVSEAAKIIGIKATKAESDHIANILHVGWVAKKSKLSFPMKSGMINSVIVPRAQASLAATVLVIGLIGSMYIFSSSIIKLDQHKRNFEVVETQRKQIQIIYDKEIERKEALGIDMGLIQNSFDIHEKIKLDVISPLEIYKSIANAMEGRIKLDSIHISKTENKNNNQYAQVNNQSNGNKYPSSEALLKFSFPGDVDIEAGNAAVIEFGNRLKEEFIGASVKVIKILKDVSYKGEMQTKVGVLENQNAPDKLEAEIAIKMGEAG